MFFECFIIDSEGKSSKWTAMERPEATHAPNQRRQRCSLSVSSLNARVNLPGA